MPPINTEELKAGIYEKLKRSGWSGPLKSFLLSEEMSTIINQLNKELDGGRRFTPRFKQLFKFLEECPYEKLKVVILSQDPYSHVIDGVNVADGIAFSVSNTLKLQPSLKFIHQEIRDTVYPGQVYKGPMDLAVWANQGVLLLNIALTTTVNKTGTHYALWRDLVVYLLDHLNWHQGGLVYGFLGTKAKEYSRLVNENSFKLYSVHPAHAAYTQLEKWDSSDLFNKINLQLQKQGKEKIIW